ncbi:MAG: PIG-L family deacetylase [Clostridia bacterium]|nr:PIG-L family deacetylase [Clostridia bacterium]
MEKSSKHDHALKGTKKLLLCALISIEYTVLIDIFWTAYVKIYPPEFIFPLFLICLFLISFFLPMKTIKTGIIRIIAPLVLIMAVYLPFYLPFYFGGTYQASEFYSIDFFANKRVMIIAPHEDDELNMMSGVIENYVECGSEIFPVFVTNGDYYGMGETRIKEAIALWNYLGVPENNIFFLGYGDTWNSQGPHIYNAAADQPLLSAIGNSKTYGIATHPAYHDGNKYTNRNYANDIKEIILEKKPDVIFINDYDAHEDHKAVSLMAERVLGEILQSVPDYHPMVYKGYAYSTAWFAADDFFSINIKSTRNPEISAYEPMVYHWEERTRLPVHKKSVSRSMLKNHSFKALKFYRSQYATWYASRVINGDKVFWQRRTDSLLYNAAFQASSGDASHLADFMLLDSTDINDRSHLPLDGIWTPDRNDPEKTIQIQLQEPSDISRINIHDNPSLNDNITNILISFSDGSTMETGRLSKNGATTVIDVNKQNINSFSLQILSYEGKNPGISEIEAFQSFERKDRTFIKTIDSEDNFVYDYITENESTEFTLYSNNQIPELSDQNYAVICDNDKCSSVIENQKIVVTCPESQSCTVTVCDLSSGLKDEIKVSNPGAIYRKILSVGQQIESDYYDFVICNGYEQTTTYRFIQMSIDFCKPLWDRIIIRLVAIKHWIGW